MKAARKALSVAGCLLWATTVTAGEHEAAAAADADSLVPPPTLRVVGPRRSKPIGNIHPPVRLLDAAGRPLASGDKVRPLSLARSCGACHDTGYIASHNYHALVGLDELWQGQTHNRPWDSGPGLFGRWEPLVYRWLTVPGGDSFDLGTADWLRLLGARHVGGGPAQFSRDGRPLEELVAGDEPDPETWVFDERTGKPRPWDWRRSGTEEVNCLLCHMRSPNNAARVAELKRGNFRWAATATLLGTDVVERKAAGWQWRAQAFDSSGAISAASIGLGKPRNANCRLCHGQRCRCSEPVIFENSLDNWTTETTGTVFSAGRMFDSAMNLAGKEHLSSPWDVHAQRLVGCSDCHYSMNHPAYNDKEDPARRPRHLVFDARRLDLAQYLKQPEHDLAKGHTAQGTVARRLEGTMRNCRDCHDALQAHEWLPFRKTHFEKLGCQPCHVPRVFAPARQVTDWTILTSRQQPRVVYRGAAGPVNRPTTLVTGYEPIMLMHREGAGAVRLMPHNVISTWFWVEEGRPEHPVRLFDLRRALFDEQGDYRREIVAALDENGDGRLQEVELRLDSESKAAAVAARLRAVGVANPRIRAEAQPYTISHGVLSTDLALRDCTQCHSHHSRVTRPIRLAAFAPGGVMPVVVADAGTIIEGHVRSDEGGALYCRPTLDPGRIYMHGSDHLRWMDVAGLLLLLVTCLGVVFHGGLRLWVDRRGRGERS